MVVFNNLNSVRRKYHLVLLVTWDFSKFGCLIFKSATAQDLRIQGSELFPPAKMNDPTRFEQIVVTVHVRWGHLMPESLALQGFLVFLFFGVISSEICKLGKIEVQNA